MNVGTPTVTRTALSSGFHRYEVDGVVYTAKSRRVYTHASFYVSQQGTRKTFLHGREDLAVAGSPVARRCGWTQLGWVPIQVAA
jgi:hypothetical protein